MNINLWQNMDKYQDPLSSTLLWTCGVSGTILDIAFSWNVYESSRTSLISFFFFSQTTSVSIARTGAVTSWDGAAWPVSPSESGSNVEGKAREGDSPEEFAERFTPSQNRRNTQSTGK